MLGDPTSLRTGEGVVQATPGMLAEAGNGGVILGCSVDLFRDSLKAAPSPPWRAPSGVTGPHQLSPTSLCQLNMPEGEVWCGGALINAH